MSQAGFFMAMGGLGVSLAGFAGLFTALHPSAMDDEPEVYRWRIRQIVTSAFQLAFLGLGVVVLYEITEDVATTSRIISFIAAALWVISAVVYGRPGPAWSSETDRKAALIATLAWAAIMAGNVVAGTEPYLMVVMLILLLGPSLTFIRAVVDATREPRADS